MRIRNSYLPPPSTLSPLSPKRLHCSFDDQITFDRSPESAPHVMISRINGRINSTSRVSINQELSQGISHDDDEEEEEEEMSFTTGNQSLEGGWREEEKAMPLKKRRKVSSYSEERREKDGGKMVKVDEDLMRCGRTDGKRWRCSRRRVEDYSMCEHHLMTRSARYRSENLKREIDEEGEEEEEGCLGKFEITDGNNDNKRKGVKARSINSL